jgi:hypothetical protein
LVGKCRTLRLGCTTVEREGTVLGFTYDDVVTFVRAVAGGADEPSTSQTSRRANDLRGPMDGCGGEHEYPRPYGTGAAEEPATEARAKADNAAERLLEEEEKGGRRRVSIRRSGLGSRKRSSRLAETYRTTRLLDISPVTLSPATLARVAGKRTGIHGRRGRRMGLQRPTVIRMNGMSNLEEADNKSGERIASTSPRTAS